MILHLVLCLLLLDLLELARTLVCKGCLFFHACSFFCMCLATTGKITPQLSNA